MPIPTFARIGLRPFVVSSVYLSILITTYGAHAQGSASEIGFADATICVPDVIAIPQAIVDAPSGDPDTLPTNIEADSIQTDEGGVITLSGNAQIVQGKRGVFADVIQYNQETYQANAQGNIKFYTPNGDELRGESMELEVDTFIGTAENVTFQSAEDARFITYRQHQDFDEDYSILAPFRNRSMSLPDDEDEDETTYARARGTAETVEFEGKDFEILHNATMTTCVEGDDDILLLADRIELDHVTGIGTADSMKVKFKGVPIFYFPKVKFPINDERKTGFLFPSIGQREDSGMVFEVPYYINIAPNQDATVVPRLLTDRGVQVYGEYRYLTEKSDGIVRAEVLPSDDVFGDDRHAFSFEHDHEFNRDWDATVDLQDVSDTDYLRDFASDVDVTSATFVPQRATLNYRGDLLRMRARLNAFETVNDSIDERFRPYEELPDITLDLREQDFGSFEYGVDSEFTNFQHDDETLVTGSRLRVNPYVSLPLEKIYGYITPKFSLQTISYSLDENPFDDSSPSASIPIFSVDSGLTFERIFTRNDNPYLQTLEPRLFYLNIPEELDQEQFPDFDSGGGSTSSFSHFFRENRFFGGDRVGDTQQITLGLTSRIINDETGDQRLKLSLGQIFFLDDREVGLSPDSAPETDSRSDFLAEVSAKLTEDWDVRGFARVEQENNDLEFISFSADYYHSSRRNARISYSRTKDFDEQLNLDLETPLAAAWQLDFRADYSIEDSEIRAGEIGITYDGCCWAIALAAQRYLDGTGEFKDRFLITFELDDLGRITTGQ